MSFYATYPFIGGGSGGGGVTSLNTLTGAVLLAAGTNITLTPSGNTITIDASGGGGGITALTGDVTASGTGSVVTTLATVNPNVGTFGTSSETPIFTVNGKGLITAVAELNIQIAESQVTNLVSDLAGKQAGPLTGDVTTSAAVATLATVNTNVGSFTNANITVNAKGLITAAANGTAGTVTAVSVASTNGFAGTSSGGATPALTLSTSITGFLQGNGTAISAATTTGTGSTLVLSGSPTLVTPVLGTPISINLANATNLNLLTGVTGTLDQGNGGTGFSTYTTGDILYASATNTLSKLGVGSTGQVLTVASGAPAWAASASAPISLAPTVQRFVSGSGTYGLSYYFSVTTANATAGATYTNNSQTYTVTTTISSGTLLLCTSTGTPLTSGTLTKATGTGDSTITFSAFYAPTSLDVIVIGGGGGSGGGGVSAGGGGGSGGVSTFGTSLLTANGGAGGGALQGGAGGTVSIAAPAITVIGVNGGGGSGGGIWTATQDPAGGVGGVNIMGGTGRSGGGIGGATSGAGQANTGAGASGADGGTGTTNTGAGGGAGGALRALINAPNATYAYGVAGGGSAGTAGGSGNTGAVGGSGIVIVYESFATGGSSAGVSSNINVITKTANYSAAASDGLILCNSSTSTMTVTLPTAVGITGAILRIKKIDATFNSIVTMATTSSQTIDGASTTTLNSLNEEISVCSDGANWQLLDRSYPQTPVTYTPIYSGTGTVASPNVFYKRSGSNMIISGTGTAGTVTASTLSVSLPTGASTPALNANNTVVGTMVVSQFVAASYYALVGSAANVITFGIQSSTQTGQGSAGGTSVFSGNGLPFSFIATVPIAGWN